jgi:hypothetical protein
MKNSKEISDNEPHPDTVRLNTLIDIFECGSSDFEYELFIARQKLKNPLKVYQHALDSYRKNNE